jgi:peptidoglycan-associated lipoprotein
MMHRGLAISAVLAAAVLTGCPGKKTTEVELAAARAAIDQARANRAADCAKEIFAAAEEVLREASELAAKGEHDAARAKASEGESLANQARAASPPGCDKPAEEDPDAAADASGSGGEDASRAMKLDDVLETIYFDYNEANIREDSKVVLSKVAQALMTTGGATIEIEGHCDSRGSTEYNLHLGERRARAVSKYLVTQGVRADQIEVISYGEERPVDLGETESAHAKNRRAELKKR